MKHLFTTFLRTIVAASAFAAAILSPGAHAQLVATFNPAPVPECAASVDLQIDAAGSIFLICPGFADEGQFSFHVIKLQPTGARDAAWGTQGRATFAASSAVCTGYACSVGWSALAPDGGFWFGLRSGRVIRFDRSGAENKDYSSRYRADGSSQDGSLPDLSTLPLVGVSLRPDGGLYSLHATDGGVRELALRQLDAKGVMVSNTKYSLMLPGDILAWGLNPGGSANILDLTLRTNASTDYGTLTPPAPLRRVLLGNPAGAYESYPSGAPLPLAGLLRQVDASLLVLPDGSMLYGTQFSIERYRPDGAPDLTFGVGTAAYGSNSEGGYRLGPGATSRCAHTPAGPRLALRANGAFTYTYPRFTINRGILCLGPYSAVVSADGRGDNFAGAVGYTSPYITNVPMRTDADGSIITLRQADYSAAAHLTVVRIEAPIINVIDTTARADINVTEFYNEITDHYFMTAQQNEVAFIDQGNAGPGWKRTGRTLGAWNIDTPLDGAVPVCRFHGDAVGGPNSHFYSAERFECDSLHLQDAATPAGRPAWRYERDAFRVVLPVDSKCPANQLPVFRFYNRGSTRGIESNHRYVTRLEDQTQMTSKGWTNEGVHMCVSRD